MCETIPFCFLSSMLRALNYITKRSTFFWSLSRSTFVQEHLKTGGTVPVTAGLLHKERLPGTFVNAVAHVCPERNRKFTL